MSAVLLKAGCFFLIILMGYGLKKIGLLHQTDLPVFSKLVTKITLPAAIIHNFGQATMDVSMLVIVLIGFLCSGAYAVIGYGLFAKGTRDQKAFGLVNASGYNIGCFTMPFVQGFLGGLPVTELADKVFSGSTVEKVYLPRTLTRIGRYEFYGCEKLQEIHFYGTLREVGGGVFTGCRNIRSLTVHMGMDEESALRDFVTEINERVTVHVFMQGGQNRMQDERDTDSERTALDSSAFEEENGETETARVIFPEYYDEAVENTPARITVSNIHGAGQKYRYCFEGRKFRFDRYDKMFVYEKAEESVLMASKIAVTRLQYPKGLWESAKKEYEKFLMENLYEVLLGSLEDPETIKWIAGQYLTPEKNPLTADKMSGLITEISKKHLPELLGMFMEIQRKKFGVKKKKFDFDL